MTMPLKKSVEQMPQDPVRAYKHGADPFADATIARVLGPWHDQDCAHARQWQNLSDVGRYLARDFKNSDLAGSSVTDVASELSIQNILADFFAVASVLPSWADKEKIDRAGEIFRTHGSACSIILFCASLPEVYAYGSITDVLHTSRRLASQTPQRIKSTARLVLPIMVEGGLTSAEGSGISSILKARLMHAVVRNLIMHGEPAQVLAAQGNDAKIKGHALSEEDMKNPFKAMYAAGWDVGKNGIPCNQKEQAYVILCFSYVLLRSLRKLGVTLSAADEEAFFHAWNVVGHLIGVDKDLMAWNMPQAEELFTCLHASGIARSLGPHDPRPAHAAALIDTMSGVINGRIQKNFPALLIRMLCDDKTLRVLGFDVKPPRVASFIFKTVMGAAKRIDAVARWMGLGATAVGAAIDLMGDRFITEILGMDVKELRRQIRTTKAQSQMRRKAHQQKPPFRFSSGLNKVFLVKKAKTDFQQAVKPLNDNAGMVTAAKLDAENARHASSRIGRP